MGTLRQHLRRLTIAAFGRVQWEPPTWLRQGGAALTRARNAWQVLPPARRRRILLGVGGGVVLLVAAIAALSLWPKPIEPLKRELDSVMVPSPPPPRKAHQPAPPPQPVKFRFYGTTAPLERVGKTVEAGITLRPALAGTWRWEEDNILSFVPNGPWPVGQTYQVILSKSVPAPHIILARYQYEFSTAAFTTELVDAVFHQDPTDPRVKEVVATLRFNYPVDPNTLASKVTMDYLDARGGSQPLRVWLTYDDLKFEAYARSENIEVGSDDARVRLKLHEGVRAQAGGSPAGAAGQREVDIPGRFSLFQVKESAVTLVRNEQYDPEQVLVFESTTGVAEKNFTDAVSAWLLPVDLPAANNRKAQRHYRWSDPGMVGPQVLAAGQVVNLVPIPTAQAFDSTHTYKLNAPPGRSLFVRVRKGVEAAGGYVLAHDYTAIVTVPNYPRELRIMHDGAVLSVSGERRLNIMVRGLPAVRIELARIFPTAVNHLISQTAGDFKSPAFHTNMFTEQNISEVFSEVRPVNLEDPRHAQYMAVDFGPHVNGPSGDQRGLFMLRVIGWDPTTRQAITADTPPDDHEGCEDCPPPAEYGDISDRRFILLTDLGVVVKDDAYGKHQVFVQSFRSGEPVTDATVEVLGKNGLPVVSVHTDATGSAPIPTLKDFQAEHEPVAYVARRGADMSFLPYGRDDRRLSYSRFDTGGEVTRNAVGSLTAYLFSDRGIYRPGDGVRLGVIVKPKDWSGNVDGVPIQLTVRDPRGVSVLKHAVRLPASGFTDFAFSTEESAPTGTYEVQAFAVHSNKLPTLLGSTTVRVEEFLPDRLRITARIAQAPEAGWLNPNHVRGEVQLRNLFGTPAAQHTVEAALVLSPDVPSFPGFSDFTFTDPSRADQSYNEKLDDCKTDDQGMCQFDLDLKKYAEATYALRLRVDGLEKAGGRGVASEASVLVSPATYLLGIRPDGDLDYIKRDAGRSVQIIAVGPTLKQLKVDKLTTVLIEQRYLSVLVRQDNGTYRYQSVLKDIIRKREPFAVAASGATVSLPTHDPGTFILSVRNARDVEVGRIAFSVVGEANLTRDLERNAELQIVLNKRDFEPQEPIEVHIKAPYTGTGLITIERDRVYAHKWFKTTTTGSVQTIAAPAELEGNGYVNVTFVRSLDSREVFMSPLSYAVVPFSVSRKQRTVDVALRAPDTIQPGDTLAMQYSTSTPSQIVVYAVDEGILQVAQYATPDPVEFFMQKRALEVDTLQILDMLLPEYSLVRSVSKIGGDGDLSALKHNLNPFKRKVDKPVVFWSGVLDASPTPKTVNYKVPDAFNGTLRVMAVAVAEGALGSKFTKTTVRGPFVLSPSIPLFASPNDIFDASVSVANGIKGSGKKSKVQVDLAVNDHLEMVDKGTQSVVIGEDQEQALHFVVKAKPNPGSADLHFTVSLNDKRLQMHASLSVRPLSPYRTDIHAGFVQNDSRKVPAPRSMFGQLARRNVTLSMLPLSIAHGLETYLGNYPYLCTEQLVSHAAAPVALHGIVGLTRNEAQDKVAVQQAIALLQGRQNSEGGFGNWRAQGEAAAVPSLHATLFLIEAKAAGYAGGEDMLAAALRTMQTLTKEHLSDLQAARVCAEAMYILARQGRITPGARIAELRAYLDRDKTKAYKQDVTALYLAGLYALLRDQHQAEAMLDGVALDVSTTASTFYDRQAYLAHYLYMVAHHFPQRLTSLPGELMQHLVEGVDKQLYTTFSSAWTLYALGAYARAIGAGSETAAPLQAVRLRSLGDPPKDIPLPPGGFPSLTLAADVPGVEIISKSALPIFYALTEAGFDRAPAQEISRQGIEILHSYEDDSGGAVKRVRLGATVNVHIKLRGIDAPVSSVAVVDLLPGGFDVARNEDNSLLLSSSTWSPDHIDVREDRVVLYGDVPEQVMEFVYRIKAVTAGTFGVPPSYVEGMYDRTKWGRSTAEIIQVVGD